MPYYRTPTGMVHMRGTKLPEPCGARVLIAGKEEPCMVASDYLCDGPSTSGRRRTCDAPLCEAHARDADPQRGLFTSLV